MFLKFLSFVRVQERRATGSLFARSSRQFFFFFFSIRCSFCRCCCCRTHPPSFLSFFFFVFFCEMMLTVFWNCTKNGGKKLHSGSRPFFFSTPGFNLAIGIPAARLFTSKKLNKESASSGKARCYFNKAKKGSGSWTKEIESARNGCINGRRESNPVRPDGYNLLSACVQCYSIIQRLFVFPTSLTSRLFIWQTGKWRVPARTTST